MSPVLPAPASAARCPSSLLSNLSRLQTSTQSTWNQLACNPRQSVLAIRSFSSTNYNRTKTVEPHRLAIPLMPPYPYGERTVYKQSNRGLYAHARIRFGNNVAPKHNTKTKRFWRPNVQVRKLYSPSLGATLKTRLTMRVLKTIQKEGGIENYVLRPKATRVKELGPSGWALRWLLMQSKPVQERFNAERIRIGLPEKEVVDKGDLIQYVLDQATPGNLSLRSRATLEQLNQMAREVKEGFILGADDEVSEVEIAAATEGVMAIEGELLESGAEETSGPAHDAGFKSKSHQ